MARKKRGFGRCCVSGEKKNHQPKKKKKKKKRNDRDGVAERGEKKKNGRKNCPPTKERGKRVETMAATTREERTAGPRKLFAADRRGEEKGVRGGSRKERR